MRMPLSQGLGVGCFEAAAGGGHGSRPTPRSRGFPERSRVANTHNGGS